MPGGPADPADDWTVAEGPAARYRLLTRKLAATTAASLLALWTAAQSGRIDPEWMGAGAVLIGAANEHGATLADLFLAHLLDTSPIGLTASPDVDRLTLAVQTAASDTGTNPEDALTRLGRAEPLRASQTALQDGMKRRSVRGWTRATGGTSCVVCAALADGTVLSPETPIWTHAGCSCVAQPVTEDR